ncbi:MAG: hypothetical protein EA365_02480 [Gloeocapsa sp. DLM2.Bin57]|nr:MAG: hypothetical protein EA365_02480 [Gloeocapsa sp. DLM2.Bin57]
MFKSTLVIIIISILGVTKLNAETIPSLSIQEIKQEVNNFETDLLNNYQSYQEAYHQIYALSQEYQAIQGEFSHQFQDINTEINLTFTKILEILQEINSRNQTKIELIETNLQARGYDADLDNFNLAPLRNATQKFLLTQEISKLSSHLDVLVHRLDGLPLNTETIINQEKQIDSMSDFLNLLAILLLVISIMLMIFVISNVFNKTKESRLIRLERKVNKTIDSIRYLNQQLETHELTLKKVLQDIKDFVTEANNYLDKFDQNIEDKYLNKEAYQEEITRLETLISELSATRNNHLNPLINEEIELNEDIYLAQYLAIYNQNPHLLWQCPELTFYEVREAQESENLRLKTSKKEIILEQPLTGAGIFWLIKFPQLDELYLFPKELEISEAKSDAIIALFNGYQKSNSNYFRLIKPAIVTSINQKTWCLLTKGEIEERI